ncbi:hypothetical protein ACOCEA_14870 [Maribacter sp. CXY002]|uniref:hypothetical protein n=1 Tax=Maribacter luteocoastalis TaxID=3407671 RepID=UPI003B67E8ED
MAHKIKIKNYYTAIAFLILSCGQSSKKEKEANGETQGAVEINETVIDSLTNVEYFDFNKTIKSLPTKTLPHFEKSNFDSFVEAEDYKVIDTQALQLDQIYPDYHREGFNPKVTAMYRLPLSDRYISLAITILKSEVEMETLLVNYDANGKVIAHEKVAYDEIAEGMSQVVSRISEGNITVNRIFWGDFKQVEEVTFEILNDGKIEKIDTKSLNEIFEDFTLINDVLLNSKLDWIHAKTKLITTKVFPESPGETIVVIPEIVDEGVMYFTLNTHIVIADNNTERIKYNYFESHETNGWVSDAVRLDGIEIESNPYKIAEDKEAFGVKVSHFGSSRVNPYSIENLSLFVKSENKLLKVLSNYSIADYGGEWDGDCDGEFNETKKSLMLSQEKTNGYFDIEVTKEMTYTAQFKDKNDECLVNEKNDTKNATLKFNGWRYGEYDAETNVYSEFHPKKLDNIQIDRFHIEQAFEVNGYKIVAGNFEPVNGQNVAPDTENDWGDRLLMLDSTNNIVYKSQGVGDVYRYDPHFYEVDGSDKIIIICQLAFEYPFGGEAFILENGILMYMGRLDIEGYYEEDDGKYMVDIIEIKEVNNAIEFTFKTEQLLLGPGTEDEVITNNNARYVYKNKELSLLSNNP